MSDPHEKGPVIVITACMRADGLADFALTEVAVTPEEYENGAHYDLVEESLAERGYEEPFLHFDEIDAPPFLLPAVRAYIGDGTADAAIQVSA